jgi:hypothetical protein
MTAFDGVHGTVCNAEQYQQFLLSQNSSTPSISCLTHGESIGLVVSIYLTVFVSALISSDLQLIAEASFISSISIAVIFIWIGVCSISFHVSPVR